MEFYPGVCPECGREIQVPDERGTVRCMFCGEPISASDAIALAFQKDQDKVGDVNATLDQAERLLEGYLIQGDGTAKGFKRKDYPELFEQYVNRLQESVQYINVLEDRMPENHQLGSLYADRFMARIMGCYRRSQQQGDKERATNDYAMLLVCYTVPALVKIGRPWSDQAADRVIELWNKEHPKRKLGKSSYEQLAGGFNSRRWCFITTAVCDTLGRPDDCYELNTFRRFRDGWLSKQADGVELINEYYVLAPMLVERMKQSGRCDEISRELWEGPLSRCLKLIEEGKEGQCRQQYIRMVRNLQNRLF